MTTCSHLDQISILDLPAEPGEEWSWCYVDEVAFIAAAR